METRHFQLSLSDTLLLPLSTKQLHWDDGGRGRGGGAFSPHSVRIQLPRSTWMCVFFSKENHIKHTFFSTVLSVSSVFITSRGLIIRNGYMTIIALNKPTTALMFVLNSTIQQQWRRTERQRWADLEPLLTPSGKSSRHLLFATHLRYSKGVIIQSVFHCKADESPPEVHQVHQITSNSRIQVSGAAAELTVCCFLITTQQTKTLRWPRLGGWSAGGFPATFIFSGADSQMEKKPDEMT